MKLVLVALVLFISSKSFGYPLLIYANKEDRFLGIPKENIGIISYNDKKKWFNIPFQIDELEKDIFFSNAKA